jgi:hypothetical protein
MVRYLNDGAILEQWCDTWTMMRRRTALEASVAGNAAYQRGEDAVAVGFLRKAAEMEPLNFKMAANLVVGIVTAISCHGHIMSRSYHVTPRFAKQYFSFCATVLCCFNLLVCFF